MKKRDLMGNINKKKKVNEEEKYDTGREGESKKGCIARCRRERERQEIKGRVHK